MTRTKRTWSAAGLMAGLLSLAVLGTATAQSYTSLMDLIVQDPNLDKLESLVNATGLNTVLSDTNLRATAFLPTNAAIENFVSNVLGLSDIADLNTSTPGVIDGLTKLLQYHLVEGSLDSTAIFGPIFGNMALPTFLSKQFPGNNVQTLYDLLYPNPASKTLGTAYGQSVPLNATGSDISVAGGTAYGYIIDEVLVYWYPTLWQAFSANNLTSLQTALSAAAAVPGTANLTAAFSDPNAVYTVFAPLNAALDSALATYGIDFRNGSFETSDTLGYHVSTMVSAVDPYGRDSNSSVTVYTNTLCSNPNVSITMRVDNRSITVVGFSPAKTTVRVVGAQIPVGGLVPKSYLSIVDAVLFPVYTSALEAVQASGDQFKQFVNLISTNAATNDVSAASILKNSLLSMTVLSPNEDGWKSFMGSYSLSKVETFYQSKTNTLLLNHVLKGATNWKGLFQPQTYMTYASGTINSSVATTVSFATGLTTAKLSIAYNISVMYGRSYIYLVDYVLVPPSLTLPPAAGTGGGAASTSAPSSLLLLGCALLAARMMMRSFTAAPDQQ